MMLRLFLPICILVSLHLSILPVYSEDTDTFVTETEGVGEVTGGDVAGAQAEALHHALVRAVEEAAASWLPPPLPDPMLTQLMSVAAKAESFIETYRIAGETREQNVLFVRVRAAVHLPALRNELERAGLLRKTSGGERRVVAVVVRGLRAYGEYAKIRDQLQVGRSGIESIVPTRMEWGLVRWEVGIRGTAEDVVKELERSVQVSFQVTRTDPDIVELQIIR